MPTSPQPIRTQRAHTRPLHCGADGNTVLHTEATQAALQDRPHLEATSQMDSGRPPAEQLVAGHKSQGPKRLSEQHPASHHSSAEVDDLRAQLAQVLGTALSIVTR